MHSDKKLKLYQEAIFEAERFVQKARCAVRRINRDTNESWSLACSKETASAKRSSMDLTRALAELRQSE